MSGIHDAPIARRKQPPWRRAVLVAGVATALYVVSFAIESRFGGYWGEVEPDGQGSHTIGLSLPSAVLWEPRFGYWTHSHSDWLGIFYSPLIRLDRHFRHPTHYAYDRGYFIWLQAVPLSEWHPRYRDQFLALVAAIVAENISNSSVILIGRSGGGYSSGSSTTAEVLVDSVLSGTVPVRLRENRYIYVFCWYYKTTQLSEKSSVIFFLNPSSKLPGCYYDATRDNRPFITATETNVNMVRGQLNGMK